MINTNEMVIIVILITVIMLLWLIRLSNKKQNSSQEENSGRKATKKEAEFIDKAMKDYHSDIAIILSGGNIICCQYRNKVILSEYDEVVVKIEIIHQEKTLAVNCYFSGKCDMFYKEKETSFDGFSIDNITKGLQELGFENVGFSNIPATANT